MQEFVLLDFPQGVQPARMVFEQFFDDARFLLLQKGRVEEGLLDRWGLPFQKQPDSEEKEKGG